METHVAMSGLDKKTGDTSPAVPPRHAIIIPALPLIPPSTPKKTKSTSNAGNVPTGIANLTLLDTIPEDATERGLPATTTSVLGPITTRGLVAVPKLAATPKPVVITNGKSAWSNARVNNGTDGNATAAPTGTQVSSDGQHPAGMPGNSLAWFSHEERLRLDFKKFQSETYHLGCSDSFVLPKTEAEFAGLMADLRLVKARALAVKARKIEEEKAREMALHMAVFKGDDDDDASDLSGAPDPTKVIVARPFGRRGPSTDGLSAVLALPSSFNSIWGSPDIPVGERVDWPTAQEYYQEGDNRIRKGEEFRRFLPVPRRNTMDPRAAQNPADFAHVVQSAKAQTPAMPCTDGEGDTRGPQIPWQMREMVGERWDLNAHRRYDMNYNSIPAEEISLKEAPLQIQELIEDIDKQLQLND